MTMQRRPETQEKEERLLQYAKAAMLASGLLPSFSPEAVAAADALKSPASPDVSCRDLRALPWCSIDNADSRDLDQLSVAVKTPEGKERMLVALADVDALVPLGSPIDRHAAQNTCSVYTPAKIFPMIPEKLSTGLSSLNYEVDRVALVVEFEVDSNGTVDAADIYRALVRNKARLSYNPIGDWLEGRSGVPNDVSRLPGLAENILLQDLVAKKLKDRRHANGALDLESPEPKPSFDNGRLEYHGAERGNRAKLLIEDFMIAANGVGARFLESKKMPSLRRIVRTPKRWERIVLLAAECGEKLPAAPDSKALSKFLDSQKSKGPDSFQQLSFNVMKLLGPGEYTVDIPGQPQEGHFGLAVKDYTHSTAPNRRFADLVTHRLLKAALANGKWPYDVVELDEIARRCTLMEDAAKKVERQICKSAVAMILEDSIGYEYDAVVTGASQKGTWVKIFTPPVEGRLMSGYDKLDVGDNCRVRLVHVDAALGHIDFKRIQ